MKKGYLLAFLALYPFFPSLPQAAEIHSSIDQLHAGNEGDQSLQREGKSCSSNADCDDQDPCTEEFCHNPPFPSELPHGICISSGRKPDCPAPEPEQPNCDDGRDCTRDSFENGACIHFETSSCLAANEPECNDSDPCTTDLVLEDKSCSYVEIEGCRVAPPPEPIPPVSCDDGDPCTLDQRDSDTFCSHLPIAGCGAPSTPPAENKPLEEAKEEPKKEEPVTAVTAPTANPDLMFGSGCALSMTSATLPLSWLWSASLAIFWMKRSKEGRD